MRLAHLILAHSNPKQLERLVKRLIHKDADIYIHLDAKTDIKAFIHLEKLDNVFFIANRVSIIWADYSMMTATLKSFEYILQTGNNYSHLNLLSGQDYPLKTHDVIHEFLFKNADKTFMRSRSIADEWPETMSRFTNYHLGDYKFPLRFRVQWVLNKFFPAKKLPNGLKPYGFSQWLTITPVCAQYTIDYLKANPAVAKFFKLTWGVDELVFQTILLNSDLKSHVVNDHLRYIKFTPGASSPKTLTMDDAKLLAGSNKFYARKFNTEIDSEILDYLDGIADQ
jgi:hypothetical protein